METLIELRHGIISPDFGKSAPNLGHHQTRHNHQPSRDMAKPLPDGVEFAGHATWPQNAGSQTNQEMDRLMNEAAAKAFPGSRAATGREYQKKLIEGLPSTNDTGMYCTFTRPGNSPREGQAEPTTGGFTLYCVDPGSKFDGVFRNPHAVASKRSVCCVYGEPEDPDDGPLPGAFREEGEGADGGEAEGMDARAKEEP
eukprot:m.100014 g.100014  ORF g.100014 m.100014 type:complete len:198 (-) comp15372_c0_seq2:170-763(-)